MGEREIVTRSTLRRELALNAVRKPTPIVVAAGVAVAGFVLGAAWLLLVALAVYLGLVVATFFDGEEAERVGKATYERNRLDQGAARELPAGLDPDLAELLKRAREEEFRIFEVVSDSDLPFEGVIADVGSLTTEMERIAGRAQSISRYLSEQRPEDARQRLRELKSATGTDPEAQRAQRRAAEAVEAQLRLGDTLRAELGRFKAEMEHLIASLGVVHGQVVRASVANDTHLQGAVAHELGELRERVADIADGMKDALARLDD